MAKGVPFREAHHIVGEAVVEAIRQGKALEELALADLQKFSAVIGDDVYPILALQSCPDKRAAKGGVSPKQVAQAIADAKTGWFKPCGLVPSPRPSPTGRGRKRSRLSAGLLRSGPRGPQKFTLALVFEF